MKWIFENKVFSGYYSLDGKNWTKNSEITFNGTFWFDTANYSMGVRSNDGAAVTIFNGSIDLSQCYIKINGEILWKGVTRL